MKLVRFILLIQCVLGGIVNLPAQSLYEIEKRSSEQVITIDGRIGSSEWEGYEQLPLQLSSSDKQELQSTTVRMAWDEEYIYALYEVADTHIVANQTAHDGQVYFDDCVEVFLSPVHKIDSIYFGFEMNSIGTFYDFVFFPNFGNKGNYLITGYNPTGVEIKTSIIPGEKQGTTKGWIHEVAIPIIALNTFTNAAPVAEGSEWKFQLSRWDYQPNDQSAFSALEKTGENSPHVFSKMPILKFVANKK